MKKKSGTAGSPVAPIDPAVPHEADVADPGAVEAVKAEQRQAQAGKYGSVKTEVFKADAKKKSWIEIELVDAEDRPVSGEKYRITLPDGSTAEGTLDANGFARVEGFDEGSCKVCFVDLDGQCWSPA